MKTAQNEIKAVESNSSPVLKAVPALFKYTVGFPGADDISFASDSIQEVSYFLLDDPEVVRIGESAYLESLEGPYCQQDCDDFVWDNIEEWAKCAGYEIIKAKE